MRFSIAWLLLLVLILALEFALIANPSQTGTDVASFATIVVLLTAILAARAGRRPAAAWWGFALFGSVYFVLSLPILESSASKYDFRGSSPLGAGPQRLREGVRELVAPLDFPPRGIDPNVWNEAQESRRLWASQTFDSLSCLLFGVLGASIAVLIGESPAPRRATAPPPVRPATDWIETIVAVRETELLSEPDRDAEITSPKEPDHSP